LALIQYEGAGLKSGTRGQNPSAFNPF